MIKSIDTILFIHSIQPLIDRGWDTTEVKPCLRKMGFKTQDIFIDNEKEGLQQLINFTDTVLVWPVCYTIGREFDNKLLIDLLQDLHIPFISPGPHALEYSSKLQLKHGLADSILVQTPRYQIVNSYNDNDIGFATPYLMKCEYSCGSKGVSLVHKRDYARQVWDHLVRQYGQTVFAEKWERVREYTVSYIPGDTDPIIAPLEMSITKDKLIIDERVKTNNKLIQFSLPDSDLSDRLVKCVTDLANHLSIDGHFRVDILKNDEGTLHVIDVNYLPQMHFSSKHVSYFPMALNMNFGFSREQIVCSLIMAAKRKFRLYFRDIIETKLNMILRN